jgi:hypothetical protein
MGLLANQEFIFLRYLNVLPSAKKMDKVKLRHNELNSTFKSDKGIKFLWP